MRGVESRIVLGSSYGAILAARFLSVWILCLSSLESPIFHGGGLFHACFVRGVEPGGGPLPASLLGGMSSLGGALRAAGDDPAGDDPAGDDPAGDGPAGGGPAGEADSVCFTVSAASAIAARAVAMASSLVVGMRMLQRAH